MPSDTIVCSLCQHKIPAAYLRAHQARETADIVAYTVELIKQSHPDWSETDPTCQRCWDEYQKSAAS